MVEQRWRLTTECGNSRQYSSEESKNCCKQFDSNSLGVYKVSQSGSAITGRAGVVSYCPVWGSVCCRKMSHKLLDADVENAVFIED